MKTSSVVLSAVLIMVCPVAQASSKPMNGHQNLQGTVVRVKKRDVESPGDRLTTPTDAPLSSQYYSYDVTVRVHCKLYIARYDTALNYMPAAFRKGQTIKVRMGKHAIYLDGTNPERLPIVHRARVSDANCQVK